MSNIRICTVQCLTIINKTKPPIAYVSLAMWLHHWEKYPTIPTMIFTVGISEKNIARTNQNLPQPSQHLSSNVQTPPTQTTQHEFLPARRWCLFGNNSSLSSICYLWIRYVYLKFNKKSPGNSVVFFCGGFWVVRKNLKKKSLRVGKCFETSIYC